MKIQSSNIPTSPDSLSIGLQSKFIAASRVNDYICGTPQFCFLFSASRDVFFSKPSTADCCDGSDEYQHGSNCSDRCLEEGAEIRRGMVRQIELHEQVPVLAALVLLRIEAAVWNIDHIFISQGLKKRSEYVETAAAKKQVI
jgi:hypothetical protein